MKVTLKQLLDVISPLFNHLKAIPVPVDPAEHPTVLDRYDITRFIGRLLPELQAAEVARNEYGKQVGTPILKDGEPMLDGTGQPVVSIPLGPGWLALMSREVEVDVRPLPRAIWENCLPKMPAITTDEMMGMEPFLTPD
jgi:hypothetical protein